jgi:hypothetical protein
VRACVLCAGVCSCCAVCRYSGVRACVQLCIQVRVQLLCCVQVRACVLCAGASAALSAGVQVCAGVCAGA